MPFRDVCDYASALEFLLGRVNYERTSHIPYRSTEFKLDRMRRLLALLGDPHLALKAVHIAGTKGKGSTAAMVASALTAAGYRTGLYTSPHLERIEERMAIDGAICSEQRFVALAAQVQEAVRVDEKRSGQEAEPGGPTFFEVTTAMAFLHFAQAKVDAAVLEVGLGGRLDSTNVCRPEVSILTSISLDHMRQLGDTLAAIAAEKAGIIKPGVPVVSGVLEDEPRQVIVEQARAAGAKLWQRGVDFDFTRQRTMQFPASSNGDAQTAEQLESFDYREPAVNPTPNPTLEIAALQIGMPGGHQAANAACAVAALMRLRERGWSIPDDAIRRGLAATRCPARIEVLPGRPAVVLDVAHNAASVAALLAVLDERFAARRKLLIFASSRDKDYAAMLRLLVPRFDAIVLTQYVINPRAMEADQLHALAVQLSSTTGSSSSGEIHVANHPLEAWKLARQLVNPDDVICITGSFFLAAELRPLVSLATVETGNDPAPSAA